MAYHITQVTNNSRNSIAITNPAYEGDSMLVGPNTSPYIPKRPILVNRLTGNPTYAQALTQANNIYTFADNFCFWDNGNSAINGIGEKGGAPIVFNSSAGNLQVTVKADGTLTFVKAVSSASA